MSVLSSKSVFKTGVFDTRVFLPGVFRGYVAAADTPPDFAGVEFTLNVRPMQFRINRIAMHFTLGLSPMQVALKEDQP